MEKKNKVLNIIKWVVFTGISFGVGSAIAFVLAIGCGLYGSMQSIWVGSAMKTYNHKYLATWIVPENSINEIMSNVYDGGGDDVESKKKPTMPTTPTGADPTNPGQSEEQKYAAQGYEKIDEGVYLKEVQGTIFGSTQKYVGYILLTVDPLRVKMVDTDKQFGVGRQVSQMIEMAGGLYGINGGGFIDGEEYNGNGGWPYGVIVENGEVVLGNFARMVCMDKEGTLILKAGNGQWAKENNIWSAHTTDAFLIVDGEGQITNGDGGWGFAPRSAIGQRESGEILMLAIDGRQPPSSWGGTLRDLQDILLDEGCINAAMLDGGSSTVLEKLVRDENGECTYFDVPGSSTKHPDVEFLNHPSLKIEIASDHEAYVNAQRYINNAWVVMPVGYKPGDESTDSE